MVRMMVVGTDPPLPSLSAWITVPNHDGPFTLNLMAMNGYIVTLKTDAGAFVVKTSASSAKAAVDKVCSSENCPPGAVVSLEQVSLSELTPKENSNAMSIVNFVYFTANFNSDFIELVWPKPLASHLRTKFSALSGNKRYISSGDFIHFFLNMDRNNQMLLARWIEQNYHFSDDHA